MDITKEELEKLYKANDKPIEEFAESIGVGSVPTLYRLLRKAGIKTKRKRVRIVE